MYQYVQKVFIAHILFFRALSAYNMQAKRSIEFYFAEYVLVCSRILPGALLVMIHIIRISGIIRPALGRKKQSCIRTRKYTYVLMYVLIHTYYKVHASSWFMECRESRTRGSAMQHIEGSLCTA